VNSVKTGVVVVVLLGVLYGVYKVLNVPEKPLTPEEKEAIEIANRLNVETGGNEVEPSAIQFGTGASPASPVAVAPPSPIGEGSNSRGTEFSVPPLTGGQDSSHVQHSGGSGSRHDHVASEPDFSHAEQQPAASEAYTSLDAGQGDVADNLPPLDPSPTNDNTSGASESYYAGKADTAPSDDQPGSDTAGSTDDDIAARVFSRAMQTAEDLVAQGSYREALAELTKFYDAPSLSAEEQQRLVNWLDPLAGKVIYSSEHLVERPRIVRSGETLADIAYEYGVPEQLLYNINRNQINNPNVLRPGIELKVVRGPFAADVSLGKGKLTLFVGELYAGHFSITTGRDPIPQPGTYYVKQIAQGREYVAPDGSSIPADSPNNPYGRWWIDLGSEMSIHGSATSGSFAGGGCISLSTVDISDLAEILSRDSKVRIEE